MVLLRRNEAQIRDHTVLPHTATMQRAKEVVRPRVIWGKVSLMITKSPGAEEKLCGKRFVYICNGVAAKIPSIPHPPISPSQSGEEGYTSQDRSGSGGREHVWS